jgi:hypothetical protein
MTLLAVCAADEDETGVGAAGLSLPQADAANANSRTPRRRDRIIGRSSNDPAAANSLPPLVDGTLSWPDVSGPVFTPSRPIGDCRLRV